ncbi:MAG: hypothetical protein LBB67_06430 [Oscillospiraceae bacterium]|jgi:hypothetical protein|nr:hypothetical protein [Oscillospiraceae bacterium]
MEFKRLLANLKTKGTYKLHDLGVIDAARGLYLELTKEPLQLNAPIKFVRSGNKFIMKGSTHLLEFDTQVLRRVSEMRFSDASNSSSVCFAFVYDDAFASEYAEWDVPYAETITGNDGEPTFDDIPDEQFAAFEEHGQEEWDKFNNDPNSEVPKYDTSNQTQCVGRFFRYDDVAFLQQYKKMTVDIDGEDIHITFASKK